MIDFLLYFILGKIQDSSSFDYPDRLIAIWKWAISFAIIHILITSIAVLITQQSILVTQQPKLILSVLVNGIVHFCVSFIYCYLLRLSKAKWQWWIIYIVGGLIGGLSPFFALSILNKMVI